MTNWIFKEDSVELLVYWARLGDLDAINELARRGLDPELEIIRQIIRRLQAIGHVKEVSPGMYATTGKDGHPSDFDDPAAAAAVREFEKRKALRRKTEARQHLRKERREMPVPSREHVEDARSRSPLSPPA
jgi:hypothetical protein